MLSKSVKNGCLNSEYICTILTQESVTAKWFQINEDQQEVHSISCIVRDNIRYYTDIETRVKDKKVYLRADDVINKDGSEIKI